MKPNRITFTGIDENTDINRLIILSAKYSVEWGLLFSRSNQGKSNRYPTLKVIDKILKVSNNLTTRLNLSAHICGKYSKEIMIDWDYPEDLVPILYKNFLRTQINIRDGETDVKGIIYCNRAEGFAEEIYANKAIVQCTGDFPSNAMVDWLYDKSGGAGRSPDTWDAAEEQTEAYCGYAGGIGPDNVMDVLEKINYKRRLERPFWIDMEGNVRTNDWLDLDKCESVLKQVYDN